MREDLSVLMLLPLSNRARETSGSYQHRNLQLSDAFMMFNKAVRFQTSSELFGSIN